MSGINDFGRTVEERRARIAHRRVEKRSPVSQALDKLAAEHPDEVKVICTHLVEMSFEVGKFETMNESLRKQLSRASKKLDGTAKHVSAIERSIRKLKANNKRLTLERDRVVAALTEFTDRAHAVDVARGLA